VEENSNWVKNKSLRYSLSWRTGEPCERWSAPDLFKHKFQIADKGKKRHFSPPCLTDNSMVAAMSKVTSLTAFLFSWGIFLRRTHFTFWLSFFLPSQPKLPFVHWAALLVITVYSSPGEKEVSSIDVFPNVIRKYNMIF
jgi:hypothetical protein